MTNKKYEIARNKLIPFAEKYANSIEGDKPDKGQDRKTWAIEWNLLFLDKMNQLAKENGLTTT